MISSYLILFVRYKNEDILLWCLALGNVRYNIYWIYTQPLTIALTEEIHFTILKWKFFSIKQYETLLHEHCDHHQDYTGLWFTLPSNYSTRAHVRLNKWRWTWQLSAGQRLSKWVTLMLSAPSPPMMLSRVNPLSSLIVLGCGLKGSFSACVEDYCQSCLVVTLFYVPTPIPHLTPNTQTYTSTCVLFSDDGDDGGETSDRESLGKKKRGPKKKKETKKKDKEGKTTKARKRKKIVWHSSISIMFFNNVHLNIVFLPL